MGKWATIRIRQNTYDTLRAMSDKSGETMGDVCDALLGGAAQELEKTVATLAQLTDAGGELVTQSHPSDAVTPVTKGKRLVTPSQPSDEAAQPDVFKLTNVYAVAGDEGDEDSYVCGACQAALAVEAPVCPECGVKLDWSGEKTPNGGRGAILLGLAVMALIGYNRMKEQAPGYSFARFIS